MKGARVSLAGQGARTSRRVLRACVVAMGFALAATSAAAQSSQRPSITMAPTIAAAAAGDTALAINIGPSSAVPARSFVRLRGLPNMAALSDGHSIAPGAWAVALAALPNLKITIPAGASGRSEIVVTLVSLDGAVLAEATSVLEITSRAAQRDPPASASMLRAGAPLPAPTPPPVAAQPTAPAPPARAQLTPADRERAQRLMQRGQDMLAEGNVSGARLVYERAAEVGLPEAAMALAATYDAVELAKLKVRGIQPDPKEARRWYERARQLGAADADQRLQRLSAQ